MSVAVNLRLTRGLLRSASMIALLASPAMAFAADVDDVAATMSADAEANADTDGFGQNDWDNSGTETIVITAARTELPASALPLTIDVIDTEALDQQVVLAGSVVDAVSNLSPSFSPTRQKLSGAGETLRGRSPLYAINGIPQSTPIRDGARDGYAIDPFFVDRVELIYGSNALQGIGATGGVVNQVVAAPPKSDGLSGRVLLQGSTGDFKSSSTGGKAAGLLMWKSGNLDLSGGVAYEKRGMFRDGHGNIIGIDGTQGDVQGSDSLSFFGRIGLDVRGTGRLELFASRFSLKGNTDWVLVTGNRTTGVPASATKGNREGKAPANKVSTINLTYTDSDLLGGNFSFQAFYNRSRDTFGGGYERTFQDPDIATIGTLFDQSQNRSRKLGARFNYERQIGEALTATIGFDSIWDKTEQALIATDRYWVPPTTFRSLAPFGQLNLKLFDGVVRVAGGGRWENGKLSVDDYHTLASTTAVGNTASTFGGVDVIGGSPNFSDMLLNGGAIFEPVKGVRAYASYSEGYSIADVGRILRAISTANFDVGANVELTPVISNNREVGLEVNRGPVNASAAYFWSTSKNGSLLVRGTDGIYTVQRQRIQIEGLELNLATQTPIDGLRVGVGYAHLMGQSDTNADNVVDKDLDGANISPDRVNLWTEYSAGPITARVQGSRYLARGFDSVAANGAGVGFDGYTLVDASLRYDTGSIGAFTVAGSNLFDKFYITYNSDTTLVTDNSKFFAGRGRVITLSWDWRF